MTIISPLPAARSGRVNIQNSQSTLSKSRKTMFTLQPHHGLYFPWLSRISIKGRSSSQYQRQYRIIQHDPCPCCSAWKCSFVFHTGFRLSNQQDQRIPQKAVTMDSSTFTIVSNMLYFSSSSEFLERSRSGWPWSVLVHLLAILWFNSARHFPRHMFAFRNLKSSWSFLKDSFLFPHSV
jgi:hypothetical protein